MSQPEQLEEATLYKTLGTMKKTYSLLNIKAWELLHCTEVDFSCFEHNIEKIFANGILSKNNKHIIKVHNYTSQKKCILF